MISYNDKKLKLQNYTPPAGYRFLNIGDAVENGDLCCARGHFYGDLNDISKYEKRTLPRGDILGESWLVTIRKIKNKNMQIEHKNTKYELNVEKAIKDGYLTIVEPPVAVGNVYKSIYGSATVIVTDDRDKRIILLGNDMTDNNHGLRTWGDSDITLENFRTKFNPNYWPYIGKAKIVIDPA